MALGNIFVLFFQKGFLVSKAFGMDGSTFPFISSLILQDLFASKGDDSCKLRDVWSRRLCRVG